MQDFKAIAAEMKARREAKKQKMAEADIKEMRETLMAVHNALPVIEGPVKNTFEVKPRIFFASQKEFMQYIMDQPSYWNDARVKKAYSELSKVDFTSKTPEALTAIKKIFLTK